MKKQNNIKVLGILLSSELRKKAKKFLHNKTIHLEFSEKSKLNKIPKGELKKYPVIGLISQISDTLVICLQDISELINLRLNEKRGKGDTLPQRTVEALYSLAKTAVQ